MPPNMADWDQLRRGVYIHRSLPRLLVVTDELRLPSWLTVHWHPDDWEQCRVWLWMDCWECHPTVSDRGVLQTNVDMIEGCMDDL